MEKKEGSEKSIRERAEEIIAKFKEDGGRFIRPEVEEDAFNEIQRQLASEKHKGSEIAVPYLTWNPTENKWKLNYELGDNWGNHPFVPSK